MIYYSTRAGKRAKESAAVNVHTLIADMIEIHPIPATFHILQDVRINEIYAAKTPLETVLRNLFNNALKHHSGINPTITISAEASGSYCLFKVIDNGPGIPDSVKDQIYNPFFTTKPVGKGTGLGLAISYKIVVDGHGGSIKISQPPGGGTEFLVKIPISNGK